MPRPVQKVKSAGPRGAKKQGVNPGPVLERTTFKTSREMDFFSEKELVTQTGHSREEWPLVFLKESIDNALDACEEHDVAPQIEVTVDAAGISVQDNGPGLPQATLAGALDFTVRASSREAYCAPDRGAQGNALMTLVAMPVVVDPEAGAFVVTAHGIEHRITCRPDPISQRAVVQDEPSSVGTTIGTRLRIEWRPHQGGDEAQWPFEEGGGFIRAGWFKERIVRLLAGFAMFNPHLSLALDWFGERYVWEPTDTAWQKWKPNRPTSPHWYEAEHLARLIAAYITHDRDEGIDRMVADLLAEFDGLSGSGNRKKVLDATGLQRKNLSAFVTGGQLDQQRIADLLAAMKAHTRPVKPHRLGIIGEEHFRQRFLAAGILAESFEYSKRVDTGEDGLPFVLESAFGWRGEKSEDSRLIYAGANWSAAIHNPFRSFGGTGAGLEQALSEMKAGTNEPIIFALHLAHPRVAYTDRGKSALVIGR